MNLQYNSYCGLRKSTRGLCSCCLERFKLPIFCTSSSLCCFRVKPIFINISLTLCCVPHVPGWKRSKPRRKMMIPSGWLTGLSTASSPCSNSSPIFSSSGSHSIPSSRYTKKYHADFVILYVEEQKYAMYINDTSTGTVYVLTCLAWRWVYVFGTWHMEQLITACVQYTWYMSIILVLLILLWCL